jgi:5S rRNA maturation endonuclease (ribonuclease M5)
MFTVEEVAQLCKVDKKTLEREFRAWCGDKFIYPGVYLVGGWVDKIVDVMKKWRKVVIVGDAGTGKSINALHAAKKISKNIGHAYSLVDLDKKINARHKGVILVDDVDAMGRKWKTILEKASLVKDMRVIATSTKNVIVSGFNTNR